MKNENNITAHRYRSIDGMRGIAALAVVIFHLSGNLQPDFSQLFPHFINVIFSYGFLGVPIFFVISGFVISSSVGDSAITPKYAGLFVLRRSIRLDPTYWASIAFALILLTLKNRVLDTAEPMPGFLDVLAHMLYLQDLLSIEPVISVVYWTLCLEVQLYLFYIFTVWLAQQLNRRGKYQTHIIHLVLITMVGIYSVLLDHDLSSLPITGLFVSNWHYFLMGVLISNTVRKLPYSSYAFFSWILFEVLFITLFNVKAYAIAGTVTTLFIYILWMNNALDRVFTGQGFQYLGKLSYTLYLVHPDVGWKAISFGKIVLHDYMSPAIAGFLFMTGILVSLIVAHIFHLSFEKPSLRLCEKLKRRYAKPLA